MDEQTKIELEEAHKKAMEGIKAFNKELEGLNNTINQSLGK